MDEQKQLDRIEAKVDKIEKQQATTNTIMAVQQTILDEHTKRSTMLESIVIPMQRKVTLAEGALKVLGMLVVSGSALAGVVDLILKILKTLHP